MKKGDWKINPAWCEQTESGRAKNPLIEGKGIRISISRELARTAEQAQEFCNDFFRTQIKLPKANSNEMTANLLGERCRIWRSCRGKGRNIIASNEINIERVPPRKPRERRK